MVEAIRKRVGHGAIGQPLKVRIRSRVPDGPCPFRAFGSTGDSEIRLNAKKPMLQQCLPSWQ
jgi:hypothetical protein